MPEPPYLIRLFPEPVWQPQFALVYCISAFFSFFLVPLSRKFSAVRFVKGEKMKKNTATNIHKKKKPKNSILVHSFASFLHFLNSSKHIRPNFTLPLTVGAIACHPFPSLSPATIWNVASERSSKRIKISWMCRNGEMGFYCGKRLQTCIWIMHKDASTLRDCKM